MRGKLTELDRKLRKLPKMGDADFYGVADLSSARQAILNQGGLEIAKYPKAISLGIALLHTIVNLLPNRDERSVATSYRHHCYDLINQRLDLIASQVASILQQEGYRAFPVSASNSDHLPDEKRIMAIFSHKMASHLAGLGWIGKSCLLITPEVGPRVRWVTILTDQPQNTTGVPVKERCGKCQECIKICPVQAFTGQSFRQDQPREARFDAGKCKQYLTEMREKSPDLAVCGLCLYICPHGKRGGKKLLSIK
jgi:epoxyqueuosine reductase